jgi:Tfp pilus assembly protein FimV
VFVIQCRSSEQVFERGDAMSIAFELESPACRPLRLYALPDPPARLAPSPSVRRRRAVVAGAAAVVVVLLVLLALPLRQLGGSTMLQAQPMVGREYVVQSGDTLASIAARADRADARSLVSQMAREVGSTVVVPGEHIQIP